MGALWYFAASLGPCHQGVDLIFTLPQELTAEPCLSFSRTLSPVCSHD